MTTPTRKFTDAPATREKTPLLVGLIGPSGTGKTFSALRLATGIQRVSGGDIFFIDTEARRALHYADQFKFRHVPFGKPFSPLDYLAAIEYCAGKGAGVIVIDSMSYEHEGPGGVLEMHEQQLDKMAGQDWDKREKMSMAAWGKPKGQRRALINGLLQLNCNFVFCFRAKKKIKPVKGAGPVDRGFQPIAGEEFIFEMTAKFLLLPGAKGVPTLESSVPDEREMIKLPGQFEHLFKNKPQLNEDLGEAFAKWSAGAPATKPAAAIDIDDLVERYEACADAATFRVLEDERKSVWAKIPPGADKKRVKDASDAAKKRLDDDAAAAHHEQPTTVPRAEDDDNAGDVTPDDQENAA